MLCQLFILSLYCCLEISLKFVQSVFSLPKFLDETGVFCRKSSYFRFLGCLIDVDVELSFFPVLFGFKGSLVNSPLEKSDFLFPFFLPLPKASMMTVSCSPLSFMFLLINFEFLYEN